MTYSTNPAELSFHTGLLLLTPIHLYRYCGVQTNKGSYLKIAHDLEVKILQFYAGTLDSMHINSVAGGGDEESIKITLEKGEICSPKSDKYEGEEEVLGASDSENKLFEDTLKKDTIFKIVELVLDHKPNLYSQFQKLDLKR